MSSVYVPETTAVGTSIAVVSCSDPDYGANGKVDISISVKSKYESNFNNFFILQNNFIKTGNKLDRESSPSFHIDINACDRGVIRR